MLRLFWVLAIFSMACNLTSHLGQPSSTQPASPESPATAPATLEGETPTAETAPPTDVPTPPVQVSSGVRFAIFQENYSPVAPQVRQQSVETGLRNVENPFVLLETQVAHLASDGFVVSPGTDKEFFQLYEKSRYDNTPIFATSDSLLHSYHLLFDKVLRTAEVERFIPLLSKMNASLLAQADLQYQQLAGTPWSEAARRTVAFFGVGSRLLDPQVQVPAYAADLVEAELANINAASGFQPSPIFPGLEFGEDYTQYIARGHYTKTEALKAYFKSMMWYGRMTFRLKTNDPEVGKEETRSAVLLVNAVRNATVDGKPALAIWEELYAPTVFFVGRSDDLTAVQYGDVFDTVYGINPPMEALSDETRLDTFIDYAYRLPAPRILGIVIAATDDEQKNTKGLRFMGQRFVPDAYIFRQLIYRNVGTAENRRGLPKGLDVFAAMGSERAYQHLDAMGETKYENYPTQMDKVRSWLAGLSVDEWTETLYNSWMYSFFPLIEKPAEGSPAFMLSDAWQDKQLNASLGSWAELKHDTILYARQVYAEMGGGPPAPSPLPPRGYVEPVPGFYARLAALTEMTRTGLESRGLLNESDREGLVKLEDLARTFQTISEKELRGEPLTEAEYDRIRFYGGELEDLVMRSADTEGEGEQPGAQTVFMEEEQQAAVIADVATDPDPSGTGAGGPVVLEVGVGRINMIHVVTPLVNADGTTTLQVAKGGVFSYYEFPWPAQDRLTDEKWRTLLDGGQAPPPQSWTQSFLVAEGEYSQLRDAVDYYQDNVVNIYWTPMDAEYYLNPATEWLRAEAEAMTAQKQYIGHQLVSSVFRSFDMQSDTTAVVTVREAWQDELFVYTDEYPNYGEPVAGKRGPYSLDVTYTITKSTDGTTWDVTQAVYANQPPGWQ